MQGQHLRRVHNALTSTGVAIASCAALATFGSGIAVAATQHHPGKAGTHTQHHHKRRAGKAGGGKQTGGASVTSVPWGTVNVGPSSGQKVDLYTLHGAGGMKVKISQFGADVQQIDVPSRSGKLVNVALGFPTLQDYVNDFTQGATQTPWPVASGSGDTYFGATIGEYANRIAKGTFPLNGTTYTLDINNGVNSLHGGYYGWNTYVWSAKPSATATKASLALSYDFPAHQGCLPSLTPGCTGFPTAIDATVTFTVTAKNALRISYSATNESSSLATVINLTNHTYFNLGGQGSGSIYNQDLAINADQYQPTDPTQIPEPPYFLSVKGTPFNFLDGHAIKKYLYDGTMGDGTTGPIRQLQYAHGYDHNWVLNDQGKYRLDAVAEDPSNGVTLWQYTDQPGLQVYTGNYLVGDLVGTTGKIYRQGDAFTLETQHYPDAPNHQGQAAWPSVVLPSGQTFTSTTTAKFGVEKPNYVKSVHFK